MGKHEISQSSKSTYERLYEIGNGSFGNVILVKDIGRADKTCLYAEKISTHSTITNEISILKTIQHPFIIKLHDFYYQDSCHQTTFHLILDFYQRGDLFQHLEIIKKFQESDAKFYLAEIALALKYLHSRRIIHKDIKLENILLGGDGHVCLADFGLSARIAPNAKARSLNGTVKYMAPEIFTSKAGYSFPVDCWSYGVIMYMMLEGKDLFHSDSEQNLIKQITSSIINFSDSLSENALLLLSFLLRRNPDRRLTADDITKHIFFLSIDWEKLYNKEIQPPSLMHLI